MFTDSRETTMAAVAALVVPANLDDERAAPTAPPVDRFS
jgi:hypothetical protein